MRAFWIAPPGTKRIELASMDYGILTAVYTDTHDMAHHIPQYEWSLWIRNALIETGMSATVQGAKVQATRAAADYRRKRYEDKDS